MDASAEKRKICHGSAMRLIMLNGTLWVEHLTARPEPGWYPASLGEGGGQKCFSPSSGHMTARGSWFQQAKPYSASDARLPSQLTSMSMQEPRM